MRRLILAGALALLFGCASIAEMPGQALFGYPGLGEQIRLFYERYAWERQVMCASPRMQAITRAEIVARSDDRLVAEVRYAWRDEATPHGRVFPGCRGFATRQFTIATAADGTRVIGMTGEQRPDAPTP